MIECEGTVIVYDRSFSSRWLLGKKDLSCLFFSKETERVSGRLGRLQAEIPRFCFRALAFWCLYGKLVLNQATFIPTIIVCPSRTRQTIGRRWSTCDEQLSDHLTDNLTTTYIIAISNLHWPIFHLTFFSFPLASQKGNEEGGQKTDHNRKLQSHNYYPQSHNYKQAVSYPRTCSKQVSARWLGSVIAPLPCLRLKFCTNQVV